MHAVCTLNLLHAYRASCKRLGAQCCSVLGIHAHDMQDRKLLLRLWACILHVPLFYDCIAVCKHMNVLQISSDMRRAED